MDAAAELGRNPVSKQHQIQPEYGDEQADAGRDGWTRLARPNSLRHARGQGNINFPCSADHEQDWQPYPVDPYSAIICDDHTYIHTQPTTNTALNVRNNNNNNLDFLNLFVFIAFNRVPQFGSTIIYQIIEENPTVILLYRTPDQVLFLACLCFAFKEKSERI